MKSLIIGMGIGQLYKSVLTELGSTVVTVDADVNKGADFTDVVSAITSYGTFDTVHICTPNYTHFELATKVAACAGIVFVEKPGVKNSENWATLTHTFKSTRFMMVKNNMWRDNLDEMRSYVDKSTAIKLKWINKNRIPGPGTWFTTKKLAFGGVSRDLMPHLLSLYMAINTEWTKGYMTGNESKQLHSLSEIGDTEYGTVKRDGIYDVDDMCKIKFMSQHKTWKLEANWADGKEDNRAIEFELTDGTVKRFELGLCPESAYKAMIEDCVANINNNNFWQDQLLKDFWIHERIENL
jgi:predicted dehydrogenase